MFKKKYLKYKEKYLELKNSLKIQYGGEKPVINDIDIINLFTNPRMEEHLNPIYGLIYCNIGFIPNHFNLHKSNFFKTSISEFIFNVCKEIPGDIQPIDDIMKKTITPIDIGRYIALKYINKFFPETILINQENKINFFNNNKNKFEKSSYAFNNFDNDRENIKTYINVFRNFIPFNEPNLFYFYMLLYCLWWKGENDNGILEYYNGISEIFNMINKYLPNELQLLFIPRTVNSGLNSYEKVIFDITHMQFKIYTGYQAKHYCLEKEKDSYVDYGEVTARNLINLICFNDNIFDIKILEEKGAIQQLIEYYKVFSNFNLQSKTKDLSTLNARDAWSKLIIKYANSNINFIQKCAKSADGYELNSGLSLVNAASAGGNNTSNFFQLIKNLLHGITKWDDICSPGKIIKIDDNTINGNGKINIKHYIFGDIIIHCIPGHYYMEIINKKINNREIPTFIGEKQLYINMILKKQDKIDQYNYFFADFNPKLLQEMINFKDTERNLKMKLLELSLTDKYDSDVRKSIILNIDSLYFNEIQKKLRNNTKIKEYTYKCKNFIFTSSIPSLDLTHIIIDESITSIDLFPLENYKVISDNFLFNCQELKVITSYNLLKLEEIGNNFMSNCRGLKDLNLSNFPELIKIGKYFMKGCRGITKSTLSNLTKLESIDDYFMYECYHLSKATLSNLPKLRTIGNYFMNTCFLLSDMILSDLPALEEIGDNFTNECILSNMTLSNLPKLKKIGNNFTKNNGLSNATFNNLHRLEQIGNEFMNDSDISTILFDIPNIEQIGNNFMKKCNKLTTIYLSNLTKLQLIGNYFMINCTALKTIDLSNTPELEWIMNNFMEGCSSLTTIILSNLIKLEWIMNNFMNGCISLTNIDLSNLPKLKKIGHYFMNNCTSLKTIDFSNSPNLAKIGNYFINNCTSLTRIVFNPNAPFESIGVNFIHNRNPNLTIVCSERQKEIIERTDIENIQTITFEIIS